MRDEAGRYRWFVAGDINGFFGLMFDNLTVLSFMAGILVFGFDYPADIVYTRMFPGSALGVLIGDLAYTWMAFRLARKTGRPVTAMPLGLDTPSSIGITLVVLGPAFVSFKAAGMPARDAALLTWRVGMALMVLLGLFKLALSFAGNWVQRMVPRAGLLGSLAGVGLALIGFLPLVEVFGLPVVGMVSLGLVLYNLVARIRLPGNVPGVFAAIALGTALYHVLGPAGLSGGTYTAPVAAFHLGFPWPRLDFLAGLVPALKYLPLALPFALLTVVGGINVTESARVAGDDYNARDILLTEAVATLVAGLCGGVAQTTPYIGQPAYKAMGARAGYTLLTGLFVGLGGVFGYVSFIVELIPRAVLAPILIFVGLDIISQGFLACPARHAPAVALSYFPTVARLLAIKLTNPSIVPPDRLQALLSAPGSELPEMLVIVALGNGFILTAMLWGGFLAELVDRRLRRSALYLVILSFLAFFGVIHSASPDGIMYFPWQLATPLLRAVPYQFAAAYLVTAGLFLVLSLTKGSREAPLPEPEGALGSGP
jgi:AGZA family xanthine/uracil permease-like MFS transporter